MAHLMTSWKWLLALFTAAGLAETIFYSQMLAFTPLYLHELGVTDEAVVLVLVGWITAASTGIGIPFLPFWGALADRYSRKPIIIRSFVVMGLSAVLAYITQNVWLFFVARTITGFALGNSGLMMTTLHERLPVNRVGLGFSIMNGAAPIGAFLGPLIGGWIVDLYGFRAVLAGDALVLFSIVIALSVAYQDPYQATSAPKASLFSMAWASLRYVRETNRIRTLFSALFFLFAGWMLAFSYVPLVIEELYIGQNPATVIGLVIGASGLTTLMLAPLLGALGDRYGQWRVLFAGATAALLLWPLPFWLRDLVPFAVVWSVLNGVVSAVFALSFTVLSSSADAKVRGRVMAFAYMPVNLGFVLAGVLGARITQSSVFNIFPLAALLTLVGILLLKHAHGQPVQESAEDDEGGANSQGPGHHAIS